MLTYEDVSDEPEYKPLLRNSYILKEDMRIYGVNLERGYGEKINNYDICPMSMKIVGPEIISENILKAGTIIKVQSINRSNQPVLFEGKRVEAVVEVGSFVKSVDVPITIDLQYILANTHIRKVEQAR